MLAVGLAAHFTQQDKAMMWSIGLFVGPLREVEMCLARAIPSLPPPPKDK